MFLLVGSFSVSSGLIVRSNRRSLCEFRAFSSSMCTFRTVGSLALPETYVTRTKIRRARSSSYQEMLTRLDLNATRIRGDVSNRLLSTPRCFTSAILPPVACIEPVCLEDTNMTLLDPTRIYTLNAKGQSKINSNGTGVGIIIYDDEVCVTARKYLAGDRACTLAEYTALVLGLEHALTLGARHIRFETDHAVFAKQLLGEYEVTKPAVKPLYWKVMKIKEESLLTLDIVWTPQTKNVNEMAKMALATGKSQNMNADVEDPLGTGFEGQGQAHVIGPVKSDDLQEEVIDPNQRYLLQFDGGVRGNPGGDTGVGVVLFDSTGTEVWCGWKYLEAMTNNMAEYEALILGLMCAQSLGVHRIKVEGDSELVVKQINGVYRVKDAKLTALWEIASSLAESFEDFEIDSIPRSMNKRADWLANYAMDTKESYGFVEDGSARSDSGAEDR